MATPKLLIFDWDGTLCDSVDRIATSIRLAAADHGLSVPSYAEASDVIGLGLKECIDQLFPGLANSDAEQFAALYSARFRQQDTSPCAFFPGVLETLSDLRQGDYFLAVATGKSRAGLDRVLAATGLFEFFDGSRCADETLSKPHPLMLEELLSQFDVKPSEAIMVGDTEFDLEMARNANVPAIAVSYGAHDLDRLLKYEPIASLDSFQDIKKYV
jgi:phosphoglycolate phosphatase